MINQLIFIVLVLFCIFYFVVTHPLNLNLESLIWSSHQKVSFPPPLHPLPKFILVEKKLHGGLFSEHLLEGQVRLSGLLPPLTRGHQALLHSLSAFKQHRVFSLPLHHKQRCLLALSSTRSPVLQCTEFLIFQQNGVIFQKLLLT